MSLFKISLFIESDQIGIAQCQCDCALSSSLQHNSIRIIMMIRISLGSCPFLKYFFVFELPIKVSPDTISFKY